MTNKCLGDLLYAPQATFNEVAQKVQGVQISIQGKVKMVILIFMKLFNIQRKFQLKILTNINL